MYEARFTVINDIYKQNNTELGTMTRHGNI
jgi:hypothetical protein